jgi:DNA-directed RNA polymerase beta subunit
LAASRTSAAPTSTTLAPRRISFAKISEPLEVPELLALQTDSFDWLIGSDAWKDRVAAAQAAGQDVSTKSGLEEIFEEISPIEDFSETMSLSFRDHRFEPPKYSVEDCKDRDVTYAAPLFVTAEFMNNETGEIKSQTVFMGDFPLMTDKGTFVINGTERVVVSQLVRSPGVYFEKSIDIEGLSMQRVRMCSLPSTRGISASQLPCLTPRRLCRGRWLNSSRRRRSSRSPPLRSGCEASDVSSAKIRTRRRRSVPRS